MHICCRNRLAMEFIQNIVLSKLSLGEHVTRKISQDKVWPSPLISGGPNLSSAVILSTYVCHFWQSSFTFILSKRTWDLWNFYKMNKWDQTLIRSGQNVNIWPKLIQYSSTGSNETELNFILKLSKLSNVLTYSQGETIAYPGELW